MNAPSDSRTPGPSDSRTLGLSDSRTLGLSNSRTPGPSDSQTLGLSDSRTLGLRSGTVLMEAVLCLPLLLFLVTGIVQFARIWEARLLTRHAAYNAARAALVYNPSDYMTASAAGKPLFRRSSGAVWLAAVNTLAWKSATHSVLGGADDYRFPGFSGVADYRVPHSAFIRRQVSIVPETSVETNGYVRVTVQFRFPLLFSVFALGAAQNDPSLDDPLGDPDRPVPLVHDAADDFAPRLDWDKDIPHVVLRETCLLPKPWSTARYPHVSPAEADFLEMR